ncbi:serine protease [Ruegeria marisrubri]|uniref:Probable periplasmic serine endoprotease DegP-like n=1 Tax=Ruegeria marisrubri TaxID=1685379 RepID=A0A0X3TYP8_9RHOB|nr:DegQ family serine endoprotease [Ruegeria marisrubri]KUJ80873.1 serine protease [Ruegeria marisrubri]
MTIRKTSRLFPSLSGWTGAGALGAALMTSTALPALADEALADLVEEVSPSVVTIIAEHKPKPGPKGARGLDLGDHPLNEFFRQFGMPEGFGMPNPGPSRGLGSGFILEEDGHIVTNNHVIEGADTVTVRLSDDRTFDAQVIGTDPLTDIALLRIDTDEELPAVKLGDSDEIRVGEDVVAIGNPFGLSSTVTTGIVSAKGRNISDGPYAEFIQTDAAINKGNSGGPLFNMEGEVVGVNSAIYSPTGSSVGLGFAVTSNIVETIVDDLMEDGQVDRGWLGVSIQTVTPEIAAAMGIDKPTGALVSDVLSDSPAEGALKQGDVILSFNGTEVKSSADLPRLVGATRAGTDSTIKVLRNGKEKELTVTIGKHQLASADTAIPSASDDSQRVLGVTVAPLDDTTRAQLGIDGDTKGVVVTSIDPDSPAAKAGLRRGDVIVQFGGRPVDDPAELKEALDSEASDPVLVLIDRGGNRIFVAVDIA